MMAWLFLPAKIIEAVLVWLSPEKLDTFVPLVSLVLGVLVDVILLYWLISWLADSGKSDKVEPD